MSPLFLAGPTPHPFLSICCGLQPRDGSQVSTQEGQRSPSASGGSFLHGRGHKDLAWMDTLLSSELGGDPALEVWTQSGDRLPGSTLAGPQMLHTALGDAPGLRTWLLDCGKRSILLARMECKEASQFQTSASRAVVPTPPTLAPIPREGGATAAGGWGKQLAPPS
jgi:hypothetical protein